MRQIKFNIDRNTTTLVTLTITDEELFNKSRIEYLKDEAETIDWWDWEDIDGCELHIGKPEEYGPEYLEDYYDKMMSNNIDVDYIDLDDEQE